MILIYCDDLTIRSACQHYFRNRGIVIEGVGKGEIIELANRKETDALLIIGYCHPGITGMIRYGLPIINVDDNPKCNARDYDDYKSPDLLAELLRLTCCIGVYNYRNLLVSKNDDTLYLGYRLDLTRTEKAVLNYLVKYNDKYVPNIELLTYAVGDKYRKKANVAQHISIINKKAFLIGQRILIASDREGNYRINGNI